MDIKQKQGYTPFGVEMKITDDADKPVPWDGKTFGRIKVRGFAVARAYYKEDHEVIDDNGFFDTGDVGTLDRYGYMQITDRSKDVIKSGGEWISSIDLENLAVGYRKVAEAAVIGVHHPKWDERPLLVIALKEGQFGDQGGKSWAFWRARSPNGGCRTMSRSSARYRIRRPARSRRPCCATNSGITCCRRRYFHAAE